MVPEIQEGLLWSETGAKSVLHQGAGNVYRCHFQGVTGACLPVPDRVGWKAGLRSDYSVLRSLGGFFR